MQNNMHILTDEEYKKLKHEKDKPNIFLEEELKQAKLELHKLREYKLLYDAETAKLTVKKPTLTNEQIYAKYLECISQGFKKTASCKIVGGEVGKSSATIRRIILKQEGD